MYTAEIVPSHLGRDGGFQVFQPLAESVGEPSKAAQVHPHAQVRPFNVAGGVLSLT